MQRKQRSLLSAMTFLIFSGLQIDVIAAVEQAPGLEQRSVLAPATRPVDTGRTLSPYFTPATRLKKAPDEKGFIQRWLVLEPVKKDITRNNIFTDNYLRTTFEKDNFSTDFAVVPRNSEMAKVGEQQLKWYALDSKLFNFKLFRFSYAINKPQYGVLFWVVTVINCPEEISNVRMAAGCNSAGMFWLNGKEVLMLSGDRDMVVDNCTSARVTLHKGQNIIRGAVINGPGMCDFCLRFIDERGKPVKKFTVSYE
ncbi:MAG: acetylxylan esterase [Williamsia sp.]|nr:acetylxylan esterase [Williamsia sp.]